jgi:hypothetical protein
MANNPDSIPTLINISPQQVIVVTTNIPPTIDALAFVDPMEEFFSVLELEFSVKSFEFFCTLPPSLSRRMKPSRCSRRGFSS